MIIPGAEGDKLTRAGSARDEALYLRLYAQALPRARDFGWKTSAWQMYILLRNGR